MIGLGQALRLLHINRILLRHGLDELVLATHLFRPVRFLLYLSPWYWLRDPLPPWPVRIRRTLEDLGPIFVKFGQMLSTRRDLLPAELADELARLQDQVPPFPGQVARQIVERAYGHAIEQVLDGFDERPLASASVAQVHTACLKDGRKVVVKVLRPGIEKVIRRDIDILYTLARLARRYWKEGRRLRPVEVIQEYEKTIFNELDLEREAASASQLRRNFANSPLLYIPEIHWKLTRKQVLVMERIHGIPLSDMATIKAQGVPMKLLGERGVEIFFTQVFRDNFFHADMHPGNLFVEPGGRYIAIDFGIIGALTREDQRYLAENLLAFFHRDYRRVAELHVESGWVPATTRVEEFEAAIRTVCEPIFEKPLAEISFGHFLLNLFQTARQFQMEVQPQLVLLQKTLLNIEGLGRQLYPELDLWATAKPFMERWLEQQVGPWAFVRRLQASLPQLSEQIPELPLLLYRVLHDAERGATSLHRQAHQLETIRQTLQTSNQRSVLGMAAATGLVTGILILLLGPGTLLTARLAETLGLSLTGGGVVGFLALWWGDRT
ncbi:MAG: ubiquinone biosynthesis regulatory protein kinase UbiB [Pseudomonadota bacterium]